MIWYPIQWIQLYKSYRAKVRLVYTVGSCSFFRRRRRRWDKCRLLHSSKSGVTLRTQKNRQKKTYKNHTKMALLTSSPSHLWLATIHTNDTASLSLGGTHIYKLHVILILWFFFHYMRYLGLKRPYKWKIFLFCLHFMKYWWTISSCSINYSLFVLHNSEIRLINDRTPVFGRSDIMKCENDTLCN